MPHAAVVVAVLALVVAGCSGDDAPAEPAATTTQSPATTQPAAESMTSMLSSSERGDFDAKVIYEPRKCTYLGPTVVPLGTKITFEFDDGGHAVTLIVGRLIDGTTREEIEEYHETHGGPYTYPLVTPDYAADPEPDYYQEGAGSLIVEFRDDCDWVVECLTPSDFTNKLYLGEIIRVIEG